MSGTPQTPSSSGGLHHPGVSSTARSASLTTEEASFAAAQELASIVNGPGASTWLAAWTFNAASEELDARPPPLPLGTLPEVSLQDFSRYLRSIGNRLETFERNREALRQRMQQALSPEELHASQGQGLVAAMREVPAPFFQEAFDLDQQQLWEEVVEVKSEEARQESLQRLSTYLDIVETHLVREIAARTDNFFDASAYIHDVRGSVARVYVQVSAIRQQVHGLEQEVALAVQTSQHLQRQRANLVATLDILRTMDGVAQAQSALQGLLPCSGGMAVDYAGAIDVLEVLQGVLGDEELLGLDCFQHLPEQIVQTAQAVDDLMTSEFLERTKFAAQAALVRGIRDRLCIQLSALSASTPLRGRSACVSPSRQLSAEESPELEALAAVRVTDAAAVERVVGWLERMAGGDGNFVATAAAWPADGKKVSTGMLQEELLPLVIGLQHMGRLPATMRDLKDTSAARVMELLSQVIESCLDVLDPEATPGDSSHLLASHRSMSPSTEPPSAADRLQRLSGQDFQWVLEASVLAVKAFLNHCSEVGHTVQLILTASKASQLQLATAAHDMTECCHAVAEAAAARWSKLLSSRARGRTESGSSSSRLSDLQRILELTDVMALLVEQHGVRGVLGLRTSVQQLCKAILDAMHAKTLSKLTTLLEQEQWVAVEVPRQFQDIVEELQQAVTACGLIAQSEASAAEASGHQEAAENGAAKSTGGANGSIQPWLGLNGGIGAVPSRADVTRKFTITPQDDMSATAAAPVLVVAGQGYHVVNTQLLLLSMLRDYRAFRDVMPAFGAEVAQRVLELLKVFNSRTCQLVLGAGAMQVSGLKSITAKHLAISCQCLGAFIAFHPALVALFTQGVAPPRLGMLMADFGRALQDYRIHHEEVCSKLVSIMRERLSLSIKQLPAQAAAWPAGVQRPELPAPSAFATTSAKQLQILSGALTPLLLPSEVHSIFGRIALMFSRTLAEAYELLEPHGAAWEQQLRADVQFLLNCLRNLPMDPAERDSNLERLTELFEQRFLSETSEAARFLPALPALEPAPKLGSGQVVAAARPPIDAGMPMPSQKEQPLQEPARQSDGGMQLVQGSLHNLQLAWPAVDYQGYPVQQQGKQQEMPEKEEGQQHHLQQQQRSRPPQHPQHTASEQSMSPAAMPEMRPP